MKHRATRSIAFCLGTLLVACQAADEGGGGSDQDPSKAGTTTPSGNTATGPAADSPAPPLDPHAPTEIRGRIVAPDGVPVSGALVRVADKAVVTTDATGAFSVADVSRPYDITIYQKLKTGDAVHAYVGIARVDPVLDGEADAAPDATKIAHVAVTAQNCNWGMVAIGIRTAEGHQRETIVPCPGGGSIDMPVVANATAATVRALQWSGPVPQYAETQVTLDPAAPATAALALATTPMTTVTLHANLAMAVAGSWQVPVARFPDGAVITLDRGVLGTPIVVPFYPTATAFITATAFVDETSNAPFSTISTRVEAQTTNLAVDVPLVPTLTNTFNVADTFSWNVGSLLVSTFTIRSGPERTVPLTVRVTTTATSAKMPDITPFALAALTDADKPLWRVSGSGPVKTVDDYVTAGAVLSSSRTAERPTTTP